MNQADLCKTLRRALLFSFALLLNPYAQAANPTWTGTTSSDFNTGTNWSGGTGTGGIPGTGDTATFNTNAGVPLNPNLSSSLTITALSFSVGASGYTLSASAGQSLTLSGGTALTDSITSGTNTISANLILSNASSTITLNGAAGGTTVLSGNISTTNTAAQLSLGVGSSVWTLSGTNTFGGGITLPNSSETLNIGSAGAIGSGTLMFGSGSSYVLNNTSGNALTLSNALSLSRNNGSATLMTFTGSSSLTFNGAVTLGNSLASGNSIGVASNTLTLNGAISDVNAAGGFTKAGAGTLALGGASTFQGGVFLGTSSGTIVVGTSTVTTSSAITSGPVGTGLLTLSGSTFADNGTAITLANALSLKGTVILASTGSGSLTFGGQNLSTPNGVTLAADTSLTVNNTTTIQDAITGAFKLTQNGTGTLALSGNNAYSGATADSTGTLEFTTVSALYGSSTGSVTSTNAAKVSVTGGGTLALGVGGSGYFNATDVGTVLANSSFASGTNLGIDTSNAGGTFSYSSNIGNPGGNLGLQKLGTGSLVLSNPTGNSYTGGTTVKTGIVYANGGAAGSSSGLGTAAVNVAAGAGVGGSGVYRPTVSGAGIILAGSGSSLISGGIQTSTTAGAGFTLDNQVALGTILNASTGTANLSFSLGAGNPNNTGAYDFSHPNTSSTYLTLYGGTAPATAPTGSTLGQLAFAAGDTITLTDLTSNLAGGFGAGSTTLTLDLNHPYLLIQALSAPGGTASVLDNNFYSGLSTSGGIVNGVLQNGYVTTPLTIGGTVPAGENALVGFNADRLYLYNGQLEVVPEPRIWALMLSGFAFLIFIQRRRNRVASALPASSPRA
jgi:fibronectin-binding autotransporter adhesin